MRRPIASFSIGPGARRAKPHVKDSPDLAAATERGLADLAAGRVTPHAEVKAWLDDLADGKSGPPPKARKSIG